MKKLLKIGDIYLSFTYNYSEYFADKINAYEVDSTDKDIFNMTVEVEDEIIMPGREITYQFENRIKMENEIDCYIVTMANDKIKHLLYFTRDFKEIKIFLNKDLKKRLAEFEYVLSGMLFFEIAISSNYLPLHASAINYNNFTFCLSGPSKSGKSTQSDYFIDTFKESLVINEDKPLIYFKNNSFYVTGSPWSGKNVINKNIEKKLDYIFFVNKSSENSIEELKEIEKIKLLFKNIHRPGELNLVDNTVKIINQLIKEVKIYNFNCTNDISASIYLNQFFERDSL